MDSKSKEKNKKVTIEAIKKLIDNKKKNRITELGCFPNYKHSVKLIDKKIFI